MMVHLIQRINFRRGKYEKPLEPDVNLGDDGWMDILFIDAQP